jgi:hypothetical protein
MFDVPPGRRESIPFRSIPAVQSDVLLETRPVKLLLNNVQETRTVSHDPRPRGTLLVVNARQ